MADTQEEISDHVSTYQSFNKLVLFSVLFVVLLLACMALGLVGNMGVFALLCGIVGSVVLLIGFAIME